jgi:pyruvate/2-oxoglutarate dehydrogenase complex dihydrolipoamide acyltransferase (E2) component
VTKYANDAVVEFQAPAAVGPRAVMVSSRVSGTISAIHVSNGQTVRLGQLLVEIDSGSDSPFNRIFSPIDGVVSGAPDSVGARVQLGQTIVTLYGADGAAAAPLPSPNPQVQTQSADPPLENIIEAIDFRGSAAFLKIRSAP